MSEHYDYVIVGSGFGGSVSALRLSEKGYRVLVIEKGSRWAASDFPKTNFNVKRWLWMPQVGLYGIMKMTFFPHVTILSGVGVGGGSLVYANTLPIPGSEFFTQGSWAGLANWEDELESHYKLAHKMLGATQTPFSTTPDKVLAEVGKDLGRDGHHHPTTVAVYFGEPGVEVDDPYFDGKGPKRTGCIKCGGCMLGCPEGSKNTLDKNYLYLAEGLGCTVLPDTEVTAVRPREGGGYTIETKSSKAWLFKNRQQFTSDNVVFSGGVLGTVDLLLRLRDDAAGLPKLSPRLGQMVRTNSESLIGVISDSDEDLSHGVAIGSILHTDDHSHVEPVRYPDGGVNLFKFLVAPHVPSESLFGRIKGSWAWFRKNPKAAMKLPLRDFGRNGIILLYMRTLDGTMSLVRGLTGMTTTLEPGNEAPKAFLKEATDIAERVAEKVGGMPVGMVPEYAMGIPSTAHILGGCCIGESPEHGVIDAQHRVYGYDGLFVCDGSAISANPGVNPSLTITAMTERAMTFIPEKTAIS